MQEKLKRVENSLAVPDQRTVRISIGLQQTVLVGSWFWQMHSQAVYCSDVMSFPPEFEGTKGIIHPDDLEKVSAALRLLPDMCLDQLDFRIITTYGEVKLLEGRQVNFDENTGAPQTEKKVWESQLTQIIASKENALLRLRSPLADMSEKLYGTATWVINKSTGAAWYSDGVFRLHGLPPQSLNAHPNTFASFIHPDDHATVMDAFDQAFACQAPLQVEYRIIQPGGEVRHLRLVTQWAFNDEGQAVLRGVLRSLDEQLQMQQTQQQAEASQWLYQQVLLQAEEGASFGYWFMDLVTRKTYFSPNYLRIYGIKAGLVPTHKAFLDLVHPDDKSLVREVMEKAQREHVLPEITYRIIKPNGKIRYLQLSGKLAVYEGNELVMIGVAVDVTAQRNLSKSLEEAQITALLHQHTLELAADAAGLGSVVWLPEGQMMWSDGFYRLLGYRPRSVEPQLRTWQKSVHPDQLKHFTNMVTMALDGQPVDSVLFSIITKSGMRQLKLNFRQPVPTSPEVLIGVVQDITDRVALEQQLALQDQYISRLEDTDTDLVIYTNTENAIIGWNAGATEKTGFKKDQVLHKNLFEIMPDLREETYLSQLHLALSGKEVSPTRARKGYFFKAHSYRLTPFTDENGVVLGVLHRVQDLSKELSLQQQLSERLQFIESLLNATIDRIVVLDQHLNYLYWNPKAEEYYALSKQRVLGRNLLEIFPAFRNDPSYQMFRRALRGETVHIPAGGTESDGYAETYLIPVKNEEGEVNAVLWIVHDLTQEWQFRQELKKHVDLLQEEQRRLLEAQAIGHIGSFEWNMGETYVSWSDEMYRITGLVPGSEPITVERTDLLVHPDDLGTLKLLKEEAFNKPGFYNIVHRIINPDGNTKYVRHRFESLAGDDGQVVRVHGTLQDVSQQIEDRKQLEAVNKVLERQNKELEAKNEEITSFAFVASHDLKEPIRKIYMFTDLLLQSENAGLSTEGRDLVQRMSVSVKRLDTLIADILELSKVHVENAHFSSVALGELVQKVISDLQEDISKTGALLQVGPLPAIWAIENQVFYLVRNLVSNALKFQQPGNQPQVDISSSVVAADAVYPNAPKGNYLKLEIRDNGIGFENKFKQAIFKIFKRLHNQDVFAGTGMGLAICRKVMENHRGFIDASGKPGQGSTFCCFFPLNYEVAAP